MLNIFFKKNSTLATVKYPLPKKILDKYFITDDMLDNCAVTFSMRNSETGIYAIANVNADLLYLPDRTEYPDDEKYSVLYKFRKNQINKVGTYYAEFCIDFLGDGCGKIVFPENDLIVVNVIDTSVKTDVY